MLTGEIRNQVDRLWDAFCTGGIARLCVHARSYGGLCVEVTDECR